MPTSRGYVCIWAWYLLLRGLLSIRHELEVIHLWMGELPVWLMGSVHSYTMCALFLVWEQVHTALFHVDTYLRYETCAEDFLWIPKIEYSPIGYG